MAVFQLQQDISGLANLVSNIAQTEGVFYTPIPELVLCRCSTTKTPIPCTYGLGLGVIVQGGKRVTLGGEVSDYKAGQSVITTLELPMVSYVTDVNSEKPYLGIWLKLDSQIICQLATEMEPMVSLRNPSMRAISIAMLDEGIKDALTRLIRLFNEPHLLSSIVPLIQREIAIRLLNSEHGPTLRRLAVAECPSQQISKVVGWLKQHYTENVPMDDLADKAHMSSSAFRQHFRAVVGISPLQYVKNLRLQNARQLMINEDLDAGSAALRVGYESPSQFSREYRRLFGEPPSRDVKRILKSTWPKESHLY